jgi:choline kinase
VAIRGVDIADLPWIEIDFPDDLERARRRVWPQISHALTPTLPLAA